MTESDHVLAVEGLGKSFGPTRVLDGVSFSVRPRSVTGLVGENGAGKSTLFNILSGLVATDAGSVLLKGRVFAPRSYREASLRGISRVFQEQALIGGIPVYENILLGHEAAFERLGVRRKAEMIALADRLLGLAGIRIDPRRRTDAYDFSVRQSIEIARACLLPGLVLGITDPVVLLDEPTSSLSKSDEESFFRLIGEMRNHAALLFVSHRLAEVLQLSDTVLVMKDGELVAEFPRGQVDENRLHALMVGRERRADYYQESRQHGGESSATVLDVAGLSVAGAFRGLTMSVREGEVVGVGGLLNSGKARLGRSIAGLVRPDAGTLRINREDVTAGAVRQRVAKGVAYVPAERLVEGLIAPYTITWNTGLASGDRLTGRFGVWGDRAEIAAARKNIARFDIRSTGPDQRCSTLSGGNQQKVVIGRWVYRAPRLLILDNPTRGVDAGGKEEIYRILRDLAVAGVGILLITDDLLELIGLSDRILIMSDGRIAGEVPAPPDAKPSERDLVRLMLEGAGGHDGAAEPCVKEIAEVA